MKIAALIFFLSFQALSFEGFFRIQETYKDRIYICKKFIKKTGIDCVDEKKHIHFELVEFINFRLLDN